MKCKTTHHLACECREAYFKTLEADRHNLEEANCRLNHELEELQQEAEKLAEALETILPLICLGKDDFDKIRVLNFKDFNVHELDTCAAIIKQALKEYRGEG